MGIQIGKRIADPPSVYLFTFLSLQNRAALRGLGLVAWAALAAALKSTAVRKVSHSNWKKVAVHGPPRLAFFCSLPEIDSGAAKSLGGRSHDMGVSFCK